MQVSINIEDDLYKRFVASGADMQIKFNEYLVTLLDKKDNYINSKQFQEDKIYFQEALEDIESGKVKTISHNEVWDKIEEHTN